MTIHNIVHDAPNSKAVIYALTEADAPFGAYRNEQSVWLWLNEEGVVCRIEEMFDSEAMGAFEEKFRKHMEAVSGGRTE
jgi:hypothetical protein